MMRSLVLLLACLTCAAQELESPTDSMMPAQLAAQVDRLVELMRDKDAVGYPEATQYQVAGDYGDGRLILVLFSIEGFGGGNNHSQYLASFVQNKGEIAQQHFRLIDVMRIGGKSWRTIEKLDAKVVYNKKTHETTIALDALKNVDGDAANFPSKSVTIHIVIKNGMFNDSEQ